MSISTILELDQGNTRCKWRLISVPAEREQPGVVARGAFAPGDWWDAEELPAIWSERPPARVRIGNVAGPRVESGIASRLHAALGVEVEFARVAAECGGVRCAYPEYSRLGVDRWLAVLAAFRRHPSPALVVDCGSAVTLDLLGGDGEHLGGYIVPGINLMRRALYSDTDAVKVAAVHEEGMSLAPGCDTESAVNRGLLLMVLGAIERTYDGLAHQCAVTGLRVPRLWFTGGDGALVASLCDRSGEWVEDLVMEGLALTNPWPR
ncbi:type III pantothenate kinase [Microbulbifer sp. CAU 1566]|uniref:type III pantothenate kinase n=1 Tax=Microbulbifer sp. CAU 1566 TaxID=2933269 RepID=UPI002003809C|nr:type III pantothenate kinase [Microbulbifer sp. CAU 1566]MCK7598700.1 type III pantothenate kinase [Microbulbifer sp. CAU 1566]